MSLTTKDAAYIMKRWEGKFEALKLDGSGESPTIEASGYIRELAKGRCEHDGQKLRAVRFTAGMRKDKNNKYLCAPQHEGQTLFEFRWAKICRKCDALLDYELEGEY